MDRYLAMKSFVKVARLGNFSRAAKELGTNQSSLSRLVQQLERELGVQLLFRTTRQLRLTEPGKSFLTEAARLLHEIDELTARTRDLQGAARGHLRIGLPLAFGRVFVIPRIAEFQRNFPEITMDLILEDRFAALVEGEFDLVIRVGALPDSSHLSRKLAVVRRLLVAAPSLVSKPRTLTPESLATLPAILFESVRSSAPTWSLTQGRQRREVKIQSHLAVNHLESIRQLVIDGLGVALLPTWLVQKDFEAGRLIHLLEDWTIAGRTQSQSAVHALYPATRQQTAKVKAFIDFLVSAISVDAGF